MSLSSLRYTIHGTSTHFPNNPPMYSLENIEDSIVSSQLLLNRPWESGLFENKSDRPYPVE